MLFDDKHWNIKKLLPYQCRYNFVNGIREIGKSYGALGFFLERSLNKGERFVYIVRTYQEKRDANLWHATEKVRNNEFPDTEFFYQAHTLYKKEVHSVPDGTDRKGNTKIKEMNVLIPLGYCIALKEYQVKKKCSFVNVYWGMMDEYQIESKAGSYVDGWAEPNIILNLYSSIDRGENKLKLFFFANMIKFHNPYHVHEKFNIPKIPKGEIWHKNNVLFQNVDESEFGFQKNDFAKEVEGTKYGEMMVAGKYEDDSDTFIMKRSDSAKYSFAFIVNGKTFGVWPDMKKGYVYIDDKYNLNNNLIYAFEKEDHTENTLMTKGQVLPKWLGNQYKLGNVRFCSQKIKAMAMDGILMLIGGKSWKKN